MADVSILEQGKAIALNSDGNAIAQSNGVGDIEVITLSDVPAGRYLFQVFGFSTATNTYDLTLVVGRSRGEFSAGGGSSVGEALQ